MSTVHPLVAWKQSEEVLPQYIMEVIPFLFKQVTGLAATFSLQKERDELFIVFMLATNSRSDLQKYPASMQIPLCSHLLGLFTGHPTVFIQLEDEFVHIPLLHKYPCTPVQIFDIANGSNTQSA